MNKVAETGSLHRMNHERKTRAEIEEEIRRRAQADADAAGEGFAIHRPSIVSLREKTVYGSRWSIGFIREPGSSYVVAAAIAIAQLWDIDGD